MFRGTNFERRRLLMESLHAIAQRKSIRGLCSIYHGENVHVFTAHDPRRNKPTALKITTCPDDGNALWPTLRHDNVLRVLDSFSLSVLDTPLAVYIAPHKELSLEMVIESPSFGLRGNDHRLMRSWLGQVLRGLEYLHGKGLCHLNLTTGSVFLTDSKQRAQLGDFDHLRKANDPLQRANIGLPWSFQPPEAELSGTAIDLWSYGVLVVECFTKQAIAYAALVAVRITWEAEMLPILRRILQEQEFAELFRSAYPACDNSDRKVKRILDFAHRFLRADPLERISAKKAKDHPFGLRTGVRDPIWNPLPQVSPFEPTPEVPVEPQQTPNVSLEPEESPHVTVEPAQTPDVKPAQITDYQKVQLLLYVNRMLIKAKEEFRNRYSTPSAEPEDQPPVTVPAPKVLKAAVVKTMEREVRVSAEFEEPSYFNLKSLELSSRFKSSSDSSPKPVVEKSALRRAFSGAARFFGLRRKTNP